MHVSPEGREKIERYEGLVLRAMRPMHGTDVWTIGYGCTGPDIHEGLVWTKEQADEAMSHRLAVEFEPAVNRVCDGIPTTQGQFDAMVSLSWNIGAQGFSMSKVAKLHRQGAWAEAADAFEEYDHYHGQENDALLSRRTEEADMYFAASHADHSP